MYPTKDNGKDNPVKDKKIKPIFLIRDISGSSKPLYKQTILTTWCK